MFPNNRKQESADCKLPPRFSFQSRLNSLSKVTGCFSLGFLCSFLCPPDAHEREEPVSYTHLVAIANGYTKLLGESNNLLKELKQVVNITTLKMTCLLYTSLGNELYEILQRLCSE